MNDGQPFEMLSKLGLKLCLLHINCWLSNRLKSFRQFTPTNPPPTKLWAHDDVAHLK